MSETNAPVTARGPERILAMLRNSGRYRVFFDEATQSHIARNRHTGMSRESRESADAALLYLWHAERTPDELRAFYGGISATCATTDIVEVEP